MLGVSESSSDGAWEVAGVSCSEGAATVEVCDSDCSSVVSATSSSADSWSCSATTCSAVCSSPVPPSDSSPPSDTSPVSDPSSSSPKDGSSRTSLCSCGAFRRPRPRAADGNGAFGAKECHEHHGSCIRLAMLGAAS